MFKIQNDAVTKGAISPGNDGNRATHLARTRKLFPLFSLLYFQRGPKIARAIYVHVLREMYKRRRLFKRSERLRGSCSRILSTSDRSVFVWFLHVLATLFSGHFVLAHKVTPARLVSILMSAIEGRRSWSALRFDFKLLR